MKKTRSTRTAAARHKKQRKKKPSPPAPLRRRYTSDLTDAQWELLGPLLEPPSHRGGRPRTYPLREIVKAWIFLSMIGLMIRRLRPA